MAFDGLMTQAVARQLQEQLIAGRINKIYQLSNHEILMQIRAGAKKSKTSFFHPFFICACPTDNSRLSISRRAPNVLYVFT